MKVLECTRQVSTPFQGREINTYLQRRIMGMLPDELSNSNWTVSCVTHVIRQRQVAFGSSVRTGWAFPNFPMPKFSLESIEVRLTHVHCGQTRHKVLIFADRKHRFEAAVHQLSLYTSHLLCTSALQTNCTHSFS